MHRIASPAYLVGFAIRNTKNVGKDLTGRIKRALITAWVVFKRDKCKTLH